MKSIIARATLVAVCICLLVGFTATRLHSGEYFIYQDAKGRLIISNQKPPPGSKIIKQQTLPDTAEGETTLVQETGWAVEARTSLGRAFGPRC